VVEDTQLRKTILIFLILIFSVVIIKTAWVGDDAYITMRTVDNFFNGYGLVWNVGERVQAYTHPLWMIFITAFYAFTKNHYFTLIGLSLLISITSFVILAFKTSKNWLVVIPGLVILIISKSFVDYSTSGLENPLSHLLFVIFAVIFFTRKNDCLLKVFLLGLTACLAILNRMDTALLYVPILLYELIQFRNRKAVFVLALSFIPLIIWEIFSIIYYGFLFPNTVYAKLNTGLSLIEYIKQGLSYFTNSLTMDPITLPIIGIALVLVFLGRNTREKMLGLGVVLYLLYIIYIGGDFMSGRFFSLPLLACVILLIRILEPLPIMVVPISLTIILVFFMISIILSPYSALPLFDHTGIADERLFYFPTTGLLNYTRLTPLPLESNEWVADGRKLHLIGAKVNDAMSIGFLGFFAGPKVYIVDHFGLADALLARLPLTDKTIWRIGHFYRDLPAGYLDTVYSDTNKITNPSLAEYYEKLKVITRDPIWNWDRFAVIWKINTGQYNYLLN
jgi:arabinofuranosyltransferase